jgi:hypothetical protein
MTIRSGSKGSRSTNNPAFFLGFALIWTLFSCAMGGLVLTNEPNIPGVLFISLFVIIGLALMVYAGMAYYTRFKMGKPDFVLSHTEARVGDEISFSFTHTFRSNVNINWIKTQLILRETATYQRGTDTTTVTENNIIDENEEPGFNFQGGQMLSKAYTFTIPEDSMHTLKVKRNALEWFIKFEADISSLPNFVEEFEILVLPETR